MSDVTISSGSTHFGDTDRKDLWWLPPLSIFLGLSTFIVYATFRVFYNADYVVDNETSAYLLSPLYSPLFLLPGLPAWVSPAMLVLWAPGGFRLTCYYYRKAYYRSFAMDPVACSVSEKKKNYKGETRLLLIQNIHRYFMYLALVFIVILSVDFVHSVIWPDGFGISIGSLVILGTVVLLGLYTFSCHSLRHLVGGKIDCYSCVAFGKARHSAWKGVSKINKSHMYWAWTSLFMVGFADLYIWLVSSGVITDFRIF